MLKAMRRRIETWAIALLNPGVPVIAIVGHDGNHESM